MIKQIEVNLLGGVQFIVDGKPITAPPHRVEQAILVYLLHQSRPVTRERLIDWFFQGSDAKQARANLRASLSRIKKQIGHVLDANRAEVWVRGDVELVLDTQLFEGKGAREKGKGLSPLPSPLSPKKTTLERQLRLYHGDFMAGFYLRDAPEFEQWMVVEQERLRLLAIDRYQRLIRILLDSAEFLPALQATNRLLTIEPLLEQAHRDKMLLLARTNQRELALHHYQRFTTLFRSELNVQPSTKTKKLHARIRNLNDDWVDNLPAPRTKIVGRENELSQLRNLIIAHEQKLITLLGTGGMGKTVLSLAFAQHIQEDLAGLFLDGIYFVPLDTIVSADQLATFISNTIKLTLTGSQTPTEQLLNHLRNRELLLILDNLEHLLPQASELIANILTEAWAVKVITTSRERLHLYEETVVDLTGLAAPNQAIATLSIGEFAAVDLFVQRAQRQKSAFTLTENARAIGHVCQMLDGLPLAIELAAGWVRHHSATEIVAHIEESMDFLQTQWRNVSPRQRSLRAVFDHSWVLLSPENQRAFAALSVFPASFSTRAATEITDVDAVTLQVLADRSLVQFLGGERWRLHATLREFSAEKRPPNSDLPAQHAQWYSNQTAHLATTFLDKASFELMRQELPNLYSAWNWSLQHNSFAQLRLLLRPLFEYFNWSSTWQSGIDLIERTLAQLPDEETILRALLYARLNRLHSFTSRLDDAEQSATIAADLFAQIDEPAEEASFYGNWARAKTLQGNFAEAIQLAQRGLHLGLSAEDSEAIAYNHTLLGTAYKELGDNANAQTHMQASLQIRRDQNDHLGEAIILNNIGNLLRNQARYETALTLYTQAIALFRDLEHEHGLATVLSNASLTAGSLKRYADAEHYQLESLSIKRKLGNPRTIALSLAALADAQLFQGRFAEAKGALREALQLSVETESEWTVDEVLVTWAEWYVQQHDQTNASRLLASLRTREEGRKSFLQRVNHLIDVLNEPLPLPPPRTTLIAELLAF